ncbi:hypothetical protein ACIRD9_01345 [Streptomyces violaceus]|uniref:hypothetical protein n=1 Tax=Streptomyces violaceus TaxID=1936 RepID=UPI00381340B3
MVTSRTTAGYDEHADRYNELMSPAGGGDYIRRVHANPCFVGAFADRRDAARTVVDAGYADRSRTFASWNTTGVRARSAPGTSRRPTCSTGRRQQACASSGRWRRGRTGCRICSDSQRPPSHTPARPA